MDSGRKRFPSPSLASLVSKTPNSWERAGGKVWDGMGNYKVSTLYSSPTVYHLEMGRDNVGEQGIPAVEDKDKEDAGNGKGKMKESQIKN